MGVALVTETRPTSDAFSRLRLVLQSRQSSRIQPMMPGAQFKKCPRCQAPHPLDAPACQCGHTFRTKFVTPEHTQMFQQPMAPQQPQLPGPGGPAPSQTIQCPNCRMMYPTFIPVCQCGFNFQTGAMPQMNQTTFWQTAYPAPQYGFSLQNTRLVITGLLWFFAGHFGAHRFYLGHTRSAIWMIALNVIGFVTIFFLVGYIFFIAVACWWMYDLYLMLTGQLRPIDGSRLI